MISNKKDRPAKKNKSADPEIEQKPAFGVARVKEFTAEVKSEFNKVVWPPKKQTVTSTMVVIVMVMIISFYLGAVDLVLGKLINLILR